MMKKIILIGEMGIECNCAYYVDNLIYGYQVWCTHPTDYWLNPIGIILSIIFFIIGVYIIMETELK